MIDKRMQVIDSFKDGKIGIFPTDTAFGIGCRMDNVDAVKKVFTLRKRPEEKALLVLVSSYEMANKYVIIDDEVKEKLLSRYWPGGLTVVLNCYKEKVPSIVRAGGNTLAVRLPDHKKLVEIIEKVGVPIVAPSANISGKKTPRNFSEIDKTLVNEVDFILPGVCTMDGVSTIIDASNKPWKILRQGVLDVKF